MHILIFTCSYNNDSVNWNPIILIVFLPQIIQLLRLFCGYGTSCTELPHPLNLRHKQTFQSILPIPQPWRPESNSPQQY